MIQLSALLSVLIGTVAQDAHATEPPPPPIVNGTTTTDFRSVVFMSAATGGGWGGVCSGTLIAPKWVLTAAHCVEGAADIDVFIGHNMPGGGIERRVWVNDWIAHPEYSGSASYIVNDVALLELGVSITDVTPMPLNEDRLTTSWIGDELTYVGFGITDDGRSDSGVKRFAQIPIDNYDAQIVYGLDRTQNVCQGDSGGAALRQLEDGSFELVGVNSFVYATYAGGGSCDGGGNGAMRVDKHIDWIANYVDFTVVEGDADTESDSDSDPDSNSDDDPNTDPEGEDDGDNGLNGNGNGGGNGGASGGGTGGTSPLVDDGGTPPADRSTFLRDHEPKDLTPSACATTQRPTRGVWLLVLAGLMMGLRRRQDFSA